MRERPAGHYEPFGSRLAGAFLGRRHGCRLHLRRTGRRLIRASITATGTSGRQQQREQAL